MLLAQYFAKPADKAADREATWHPLANFLEALTAALCKSAVHLLKDAATDASLRLPAAADAARALHACRMLLKFHLVRYLAVPPIQWRMAYSVHRNAERADCAELPVRMHTVQKTATTVSQELLRLLMLQSCSPEMMTPEQIVVADWAVEQLGHEFTLRPPGVADNPFCFDPTGERPPCRAAGLRPMESVGLRYFGTGTGHDALGRIYKQLATTGSAEIGSFGKDPGPARAALGHPAPGGVPGRGTPVRAARAHAGNGLAAGHPWLCADLAKPVERGDRQDGADPGRGRRCTGAGPRDVGAEGHRRP